MTVTKDKTRTKQTKTKQTKNKQTNNHLFLAKTEQVELELLPIFVVSRFGSAVRLVSERRRVPVPASALLSLHKL